MEETTLRNMALLCSVIGLILLFWFSGQIRLTADIDKITIDNIGLGVRVCGNIISERVSNNHIFLDIEDQTGKIKFVIFNTTAFKLNETGISPYELKEGIGVCVPGVVEEHPKGSGELELIYRKGDIIIT
ncbi:MAG: OB-fold nucleic acid binding domain-containing protein [Candidatus Aenigmatarchaeota archaeon]|nr:MAG: OB-fold nucleic acid binding domain-containing protein [Candidatus Aenigmarchaeota archaeon]